MAMDAFDLAERFQTPVFVLSDLDLGMNSWMTKPLPYPEKPFDRGKVLTRERSEQTRVVGALSRRRSRRHSVSHAAGNQSSERRLLHARHGPRRRRALLRTARRVGAQSRPARRKHDTARSAVPQPVVEEHGNPIAIIAYGTTHHAVVEARDLLRADGSKSTTCACARCRSGGCRGVYRAPRARLRRRAESRRPDVQACCARSSRPRDLSRPIDSSLQRRSDRRARHHRSPARGRTPAA